MNSDGDNIVRVIGQMIGIRFNISRVVRPGYPYVGIVPSYRKSLRLQQEDKDSSKSLFGN